MGPWILCISKKNNLTVNHQLSEIRISIQITYAFCLSSGIINDNPHKFSPMNQKDPGEITPSLKNRQGAVVWAKVWVASTPRPWPWPWPWPSLGLEAKR